MRQIKFRAWHAESQEMVNFSNEKLCTDEYQRAHLAGLMAGKYGDVLMQFTGLLDANGVEIYEGDILNSDYFSGNLEIYYCEEIASYLFKSSAINGGFAGFHQYESKNFAVIGNIYQNQEPLE